MPRRSLLGLLSGGLLLLAVPGAAPAASVTVRVEGASATVVPTTAVTTAPGSFTKGPGAPPCSRTSTAGALEQVTGGDWGGSFDSLGQRVERIAAETHLFSGGRYWSLYVNNRASDVGACAKELQEGDQVLFYAACATATTGCFSGEPLVLTAPRTAPPGQPVALTVEEVTTTYGPAPDFTASATQLPSAGATVTAGGASATTDAAGRASVMIGDAGTRGPVAVVVTKGGRARATAGICVTTGADGACGSPTGAPAAGAVSAAGATACATSGADGRCGTRDREAPRATIAGLRTGRVYARARAPRQLSGTVVAPGLAGQASTEGDPSGLSAVKLRLTRRDGGRCFRFSGSRERFVGARCGAANGTWLRIGDRARWSYLLPARLPRGRYVLDVKAFDRADNQDEAWVRGRNRVVFRVR